MVKSSLSNHKEKKIELTLSDTPSSSSSCKYKGVRKRKWGKYVSEIRLPNSRERIWLGSYDTAVKAARAFDAALYCLRGSNAKFNFPDNPPEIANGRTMTPAEIQVAATRFAHEDPGRVVNMDSGFSDTTSSGDVLVQSPCASVSGGVSSSVVQHQMEGESTEMPLDNSFLDQFLTLGTAESSSNIHDAYGLFPGFDDYLSGDYYLPPPLPNVDYWPENNCDQEYSTHGSFLWNF